ncbi:MAG TPA: endonuclease III [Gammaproteobacteria bacterium]|nr:endonuclease III [Gammaproteobacteria bacterium]
MVDTNKLTRRLLRAYPDPHLALHFSNPLELLVATVLSAQCTDARVNEVTRTLFRDYPKARDYADADLQALEAAIRPTGFYRNKAKTLKACCQKLVAEHGGRVPRAVEALTALPGVGRKTANLVRAVAFGDPAVAVDTHVARVSRRLGRTAAREPARIERDLAAAIPKNRWTPFTLAMILHGRELCTARRPACARCPLYDLCAWPDKAGGGT